MMAKNGHQLEKVLWEIEHGVAFDIVDGQIDRVE